MISGRRGDVKNRDGGMGITISPESWNDGYKIEAQKYMANDVVGVVSGVFESNKGAITSYEKL